jgi:hypothetical protein
MKTKQTEFIKNNFLNLVVLIVLGIVLFQTCDKSKQVVTPTIKKDTVWIHKDSTVYSKPQVVKTQPYAVPIDRWNTEYLPDTNYSKLVLQYEAVVRELLSKNISVDSVKIDSVGYVHVTDTVTKNLITGRSYKYSLKYPVITNTITIPEKKRNQYYIGGLVQAEPLVDIRQLSAGLLLKTKYDHIYGVNAGFTRDGQVIYGIQTYWKIKLR